MCGVYGMPYIRGENRESLTFAPMCLDDYIEPDSICRVIAAYVGNLDMMGLGFKYAETKSIGRPPHDPASMLMRVSVIHSLQTDVGSRASEASFSAEFRERRQAGKRLVGGGEGCRI